MANNGIQLSGTWMLSTAALMTALGLSLTVGGTAAQEASSLEAAVQAAGVTDEKTLDLARQADEINRLIEEREGLSDEEAAFLDHLESVGDPAEAMRQYMKMRNAESE
jgi:predicted component of type VI protein secretion system